MPAAVFGDSEAAFRYEHDPRLNAKAMADIIADDSAVYGFSPSPDGSLAVYAQYDWTDPEAVESYKASRIEYLEEYSRMYEIPDEMSAKGASTEEKARTVSAKRNELRLDSYKDDPDGLAAVKERNLQKYGHEEGPAADDLYEQYGSWDEVITKAFSHNAGMDACVGIYDDYYDFYVVLGYVEDEQTAPASREYAAAMITEAAGIDTAGDLAAFSDEAQVDPLYRESLAKAAAAGILKGYTDGTIRPKNGVRRIEALALIARSMPSLDGENEAAEFSDVPPWAKEDVERLSRAGVLKQNGGVIGADERITIAELKALLEALQ